MSRTWWLVTTLAAVPLVLGVAPPRGDTTSVVLRDVDVVPRGQRGYRYRSC